MAKLPTVDFCGREISRLIVGGNTVSGTSHFSKEMDTAMEDYFTVENIKKMLFRCQELGINTMQMRGDKHIMRLLREFRLEGGNLNWIAQSAPEMGSFDANAAAMASYKPALMYHYGCVTDDLYHAGDFDELTRRLGVIRGTGVPVGLCTHMPEVVKYSEAHHWDVDFYMCCVYNISKIDRVSKEVTGVINNGEPFDAEDPAVMYRFIRSTEKPCLAFKILAASRRCATPGEVRGAFGEAFANIKGSDAVIVGMFQRDHDQVAENAAIVADILK